MRALTHGQIWAAIDALAASRSMSPSALARRSGLDPTAFNKSKRQSADGRLRWPSTESLAKVIEATGVAPEEFFALILGGTPASRPARRVPLIGFAQAGSGGFFDDAGFPAGQGWEEIEVPSGVGEAAYALSVQGDSMLPLYRDGDVLVVDPQARLRTGDRIVVRTRGGEVMAKVLKRMSPAELVLSSLNPEHPDRSFALTELEWTARVVWASQ